MKSHMKEKKWVYLIEEKKTSHFRKLESTCYVSQPDTLACEALELLMCRPVVKL